MKISPMYRWVVAGCLVYSFAVKADEGVISKNGTTAIKHGNAKLMPEHCGYNTAQIILREIPLLGEFPWLALLKYRVDNGPQFRCVGSLINERYVLTVAECVNTIDNPLVAVRVGEHNINTDPDCTTAPSGTECAAPIQDIAIDEVIPYPQSNSSSRNDYNVVALVRLQTPVKFNDYVQPVCLPFGEVGMANLTGKKLLVAGWSTTENRAQSDVKDKARVSIVSFNECFEKYKADNVFIDSDKEICARKDSLIPWCGISGSPLMGLSQAEGENRWYSHGLLSFGAAVCNDKAFPDVYTKTFYFLNWILDAIRP